MGFLKKVEVGKTLGPTYNGGGGGNDGANIEFL